MLIRVVGPVQVERSDGSLASLRPMERRLIAALVVTRPHPASTAVLAEALWPRGAPRSANKTIQTNVLRVRQVLGDDVIKTEVGGYVLGADVKVDVDDLLRWTDQSTDTGYLSATQVGSAVALQEICEWAAAEPMRARIDEIRREAEVDHLADLVERGHPAAVAACEAYVAAEPLDESGWCLLVRSLRDSGKVAVALHAWERARRTLVEELGTSPGPALNDLLESLLSPRRSDVPGESSRLSPRDRAEEAIRRTGHGWQTGLDASDPVVEELEASLAAVQPGPTPLRSRLLARWAVASSHHRGVGECATAARSAVAIATALDSPVLLAEAWHALAVVMSDPARGEERRAAVAALINLSDRHARPEWREWAVPVLARSECLAGWIDHAVELLSELDGPEAALLTASTAGDWVACRIAAAQMRELAAERLFDPNAATLQEMGMLGVIALHDGSARTPNAVGLEWPLETMEWSMRAWIADAQARSGATEMARRSLEGMDPEALVSLDQDGYTLPLLAMLADAAHLAGCPAIAEVVADQLDPFVRLTIVDPGLLYRGSASHAAGLAAATCGRSALARQLLTEAMATHTAQGSDWMFQRSVEARAKVVARL